MTFILALLEHFHPKFKGAVSFGGVGVGVVAVLLALGAQLTDAEKVLIENGFILLGTYIAPSPSDPTPASLVSGVAQTFELATQIKAEPEVTTDGSAS